MRGAKVLRQRWPLVAFQPRAMGGCWSALCPLRDSKGKGKGDSKGKGKGDSKDKGKGKGHHKGNDNYNDPFFTTAELLRMRGNAKGKGKGEGKGTVAFIARV